MNASQILAKLDVAQIDNNRAPDARRVLRNEAVNLRSALQSKDAARIQAAMKEALRVLAMWDGY